MSEQQPPVPPDPDTPPDQPYTPPQQPPSTPPPPASPPPYQPPPAAQPTWQPSGPSGPRSSFGRRVVAYLLDGIIIAIVAGIVTAILNQNIGYAVDFLGGAAYFTFLDGGPKGQTLGKMALGIRVIDFAGGGSIGYGRGVVRWIGLIISAIPCGLGFLWMLWDKEKQGWQDKLANSVVVPVEYYPVT